MPTPSSDRASLLGSAVAFGGVALATAVWKRSESSSEDLERAVHERPGLIASTVGHAFWGNDHTLEEWVQGVPKIELHCHLDGAFSPETLWEFIVANPDMLHCLPVEKYLPWQSPKEDDPLPIRSMVQGCTSATDFRHLCTCRRRYANLRLSQRDLMKNRRLSSGKKTPGSLRDMLTCFEFFLPLVYNKYDLLEHLAVDFCKRQMEQNVVYTEVRYAPHILADDAKLACQAVSKGLETGCALYQITVKQILCAMNFSPQWSAEVVELAREFGHSDMPCRVVGIDIAAGEDHFTKKDGRHLEMCQKAQAYQIPITIHAGETPGSSENVTQAILDYGAQRIGHGYHVLDNPKIIALVKERDIHLEVCPTSSIETGGWVKTGKGWKDHPATHFRKHGVSMSLSSDDPAVFNTSLTWQYRIALKKMEWTKQDILDCLEHAVQAAFATDEEKKHLAKQLETAYRVPNAAFSDQVHYE